MFGIALGVAALIMVLSVMNGFQKELRARILGVASHVQITGVDSTIVGWQKVSADAKLQKKVVAAAPYVMAQAMMALERQRCGADHSWHRARDGGSSRRHRHAYEKRQVSAELKAGKFGIVLGRVGAQLACVPGRQRLC